MFKQWSLPNFGYRYGFNWQISWNLLLLLKAETLKIFVKLSMFISKRKIFRKYLISSWQTRERFFLSWSLCGCNLLTPVQWISMHFCNELEVSVLCGLLSGKHVMSRHSIHWTMFQSKATKRKATNNQSKGYWRGRGRELEREREKSNALPQIDMPQPLLYRILDGRSETTKMTELEKTSSHIY